MRKIVSPLIFSALFAISGSVAATPNVAAGLWEINVVVTMAGTSLPTMTTQQCFNGSDVADTKQLLPAGGNCTVDNYKLSGNSASWNMQCKGTLPMTGSGSATFGTGDFSGTLAMTLGSGSAATQTTQTFTAHRIGNCSK
jgi:hypothetical protein